MWQRGHYFSLKELNLFFFGCCSGPIIAIVERSDYLNGEICLILDYFKVLVLVIPAVKKKTT